MNYSQAKSKFTQLKYNLHGINIFTDKTKVDFFHYQCRSLLTNYYGGINAFQSDLDILIADDITDKHTRLQRLDSLIQLIISDLETKELIDSEKNESDLKKLQKENEGYKRDIALYKQEISNLNIALAGQRQEIANIRNEHQEHVDAIRDGYQNQIDGDRHTIALQARGKKWMYVMVSAFLTYINASIPFLIDQFNWVISGIVEVGIIGILLIAYAKKVPEYVVLIINVIIAIVSTVLVIIQLS